MYYRVKFKDGKVINKFLPKCLEKTSKSFLMLDYYAYRCGSEEVLNRNIELLVKGKEEAKTKKEVPIREVEKVTINYQRNKETAKHSDYNLVFGNPYLDELFESKNGKFKNVKETRNGEPILDHNSKPYIEMEKYIFDELKNNSKVFTEKVCKHKSDFTPLFSQYAYLEFLNQQGAISYEELSDLKEKESAIRKALEDYRNYRWLAVDRHNYELREMNRELREMAREEKKKSKYKEKETSIDEYNKEYDEFLSSDEYNQMASKDDTVRVPGKRK